MTTDDPYLDDCNAQSLDHALSTPTTPASDIVPLTLAPGQKKQWGRIILTRARVASKVVLRVAVRWATFMALSMATSLVVSCVRKQ